MNSVSSILNPQSSDNYDRQVIIDFMETVNLDPKLQGWSDCCQLDSTGCPIVADGKPLPGPTRFSDGRMDWHKTGMVILHKESGYKTCIPYSTIKDHYPQDWDQIRDIIYGKREGNIVWHMSRVVGYMSRISNWNKSKLGELDNRHKGDYSIKED